MPYWNEDFLQSRELHAYPTNEWSWAWLWKQAFPKRIFWSSYSGKSEKTPWMLSISDYSGPIPCCRKSGARRSKHSSNEFPWIDVCTDLLQDGWPGEIRWISMQDFPLTSRKTHCSSRSCHTTIPCKKVSEVATPASHLGRLMCG